MKHMMKVAIGLAVIVGNAQALTFKNKVKKPIRVELYFDIDSKIHTEAKQEYDRLEQELKNLKRDELKVRNTPLGHEDNVHLQSLEYTKQRDKLEKIEAEAEKVKSRMEALTAAATRRLVSGGAGKTLAANELWTVNPADNEHANKVLEFTVQKDKPGAKTDKYVFVARENKIPSTSTAFYHYRNPQSNVYTGFEVEDFASGNRRAALRVFGVLSSGQREELLPAQDLQ